MRFACENIPTGAAKQFARQLVNLVPKIRSARLTMQAPAVSDFDVYAQIVCGERGRHVGGPMSREDAWYDFIQMASGWLLHGHGGFRVCINGDDAPIGFVVLGFEPGDREVELGYLLTAAAEGRGYASEASVAVRDWAFQYYGWNSLVSYIDRDNERSIKLAERIGAVRDRNAQASMTEHLPDFYVYRHSAAQ